MPIYQIDGYAHSVSGSSAEGYNGQATLNVTF